MKNENYYTIRNIQDVDRIAELLEELPYFCEEYFLGIAHRTSCQTRLKYAFDLRIFFDYLCQKVFKSTKVVDLTLEDLKVLDHEHIERFIHYLSHYRFRGKNLSCDERAKARKLSAVRAMFKYFFNKGKLPSNVAAKVSTPKLHDKEIIRLDAVEVSELIDVAESGSGLSRHAAGYHAKTRVRDTAILTLFLGTGIRISELVGLDNDSFDFSENSFVVTRKGGNRAILFFSDEVKYALQEYIVEKNNDPKTPKDEPAFFLSMQYKRINVRSVEILVKKYSKIVSPLKKITPHKLRSTYGTRLYTETGDIYIVADVLGHRDVNTTKRHYAAINEDNRRKVAGVVKLRQENDEPNGNNNDDSNTENDGNNGNGANG
ncbi:MAG: tyrosine-type recombinase/integrase [Clostridia bacterium]|nr:tyrosine-type recombinase/integrase [Clostridia bacterium]